MMYDVVNKRSGFEHVECFANREEAERFFADEAENIGGPVELRQIDGDQVRVLKRT